MAVRPLRRIPARRPHILAIRLSRERYGRSDVGLFKEPFAGVAKAAEELHRPVALGCVGKGMGKFNPIRVDDESNRTAAC